MRFQPLNQIFLRLYRVFCAGKVSVCFFQLCVGSIDLFVQFINLFLRRNRGFCIVQLLFKIPDFFFQLCFVGKIFCPLIICNFKFSSSLNGFRLRIPLFIHKGICEIFFCSGISTEKFISFIIIARINCVISQKLIELYLPFFDGISRTTGCVAASRLKLFYLFFVAINFCLKRSNLSF